MIITIDIPDSINRRLEIEKRKTGISKSLQVRTVLTAHFAAKAKRAERAA